MTARKPLATVNGVGHPADACPPIRSDDTLIAEGWCRRYLADKPRSEEARQLYTSLGYEVLLRSPKPSQLRSECKGCEESACHDYFIVYTRRRDDRE